MGPSIPGAAWRGNMKEEEGGGGGGGEYVLAWQPMIDPLTFIWAYTIPEHKINSSQEK